MDLKSDRAINPEALRQMTEALTYRGPDGEGYMVEPGIGLGHRRLSVIDPEGGAQPFTSASGDTTISYNGEIYNYLDLKTNGDWHGHQFNTNSDTELLTELWDKKRIDALTDLKGMFAISAWTRSSNSLTLVRDRLGERPLYYHITDDGFLLFASEVNALLASGLIQANYCPKAIADYFAYGFILDPRSIYSGILKLPPASYIQFQRGRPVPDGPTRYWNVYFSARNKSSYADLVDEMSHRLDNAVRSQIIADVPLGAFLSGGVDSGAVVASMALSQQTAVQTSTIGFKEDAFDERQYAREVCTRYGTDHTETEIDLRVAELIDTIARTYGEPFADSSALPTYLVCKETRKHVTVALSGDGSDEIFAGYRRYPFFVREENIKSRFPDSLRPLMFGSVAKLYPKADWAPRPLRLKTTLQALSETPEESYFRAVSMNRPDCHTGVFSESFRTSLADYQPFSLIAEKFASADTEHPLLAAQYTDLHTWLPGRMLVKVDRASMANSLEVRPPFLDHELVEWSATLDPMYKLQGMNGKRILKDANRDRLPATILDRPKQGFGLPVTRWLRATENNPIDYLYDVPKWRTCGILDVPFVERMISAHKSGRSDYAQEIWTVIMFNAFLNL